MIAKWFGLPPAVIRMKVRMELMRTLDGPQELPYPIRALMAKIEEVGGTVERLEALDAAGEAKDRGALN